MVALMAALTVSLYLVLESLCDVGLRVLDKLDDNYITGKSCGAWYEDLCDCNASPHQNLRNGEVTTSAWSAHLHVMR